MSSEKLLRIGITAIAVSGLSICTACPEDYDEQVRLGYEDCQSSYDARTNQSGIKQFSTNKVRPTGPKIRGACEVKSDGNCNQSKN